MSDYRFRKMQSECCTGQIECNNVTSFDDVINECIFIEKVYDGRTFKREAETDVTGLNIFITPSIDSIKSIDFEVTYTDIRVSLGAVYLNNHKIPYPYIYTPGPAGDQLVLNQKYIYTKQCQETRMGTTFSFRESLGINYTVEITVNGVGLSNGNEVSFTGKKEVYGMDSTSVHFDDMCFPPRSPFPVSTITPCLANGFFDMTSYEFDSSMNLIKIYGVVMVCMSFETKIKVPVQICVLSAGECKLKEEDPLCEKKDYPPLYPLTDTNKKHKNIK